MFSISAVQLTDAERDELSKKNSDKNKQSGHKHGKALLTSPAVFRVVHGDPAGWCGAEVDDYFTACDVYTATTDHRDADIDPDVLEFATPAGQDALTDIITTLAATADTELDAEDLDHYQGLLLAPVATITARRTVKLAGGWAA